MGWLQSFFSAFSPLKKMWIRMHSSQRKSTCCYLSYSSCSLALRLVLAIDAMFLRTSYLNCTVLVYTIRIVVHIFVFLVIKQGGGSTSCTRTSSRAHARTCRFSGPSSLSPTRRNSASSTDRYPSSGHAAVPTAEPTTKLSAVVYKKMMMTSDSSPTSTKRLDDDCFQERKKQPNKKDRFPLSHGNSMLRIGDETPP
jgi:hypothetical protein